MQNVIRALQGLEGTTLVLTHHNADIDAISSALGLEYVLRKLGKNVVVGAAESVSAPARKLLGDQKIVIDPDCSKFKNVIVVETSVPEQLASVRNLRADILIDHHPPGPLKADVSYIDQSIKSASQIVFEIMKILKVEPDSRMAAVLAAGIVADTAHMRLADSRSLFALAELIERVPLADVLALVEMEQTTSDRVAALKAASRMELYKIGELLVAFSKVVSHEANACRALLKVGADIAVVVAEKDVEVRISSRGRNDILKYGIDLSVVFADVGKAIGGTGGGHDQAGSANGPDRTGISEAKKLIIHYLEKKAGKQAKLLE